MERFTTVGQNSQNPGFADLYFMDSAQATDIRLHNAAENAGCKRWVMVALDAMLREVNSCALLYESMWQVFEEEQLNAVAENREQLEKTHSLFIIKDNKKK